MSNARHVSDIRVEPSGGAPTWWLVFTNELQELWIGGKAPVLLLIFSVLLGIMTWVMASNSELSLIPPQEMVYETTKAAIAVGLFMSLIIGADSISGERERATLEGLLLTPTSRRQLVVGKFLAGVSPWPVAMLIAIPYMKVLSQGDEVFRHALPWGALLGTVLAPAFTAVGMLTSFWSSSNKTSLFTSLGIYVLFLVPTQLPGRATTGAMGMLLSKSNPIESTFVFLSRILVNNRMVTERWTYLISPTVFALGVYVLLFWYASPGLHLEGGQSGKLWSSVGRRLGFAATVGLLMVLLGGSPAMALQAENKAASTPAASTPEDARVQISINAGVKVVKTGDRILYDTVVTNNGQVESRSLVVAMNIINLNAAGDIVDPEDWSPQRTQYIDSIPAGQSKTLSWRVNAILDGNYLVYMVLVPEPEGRDSTTTPTASSGLHLTVNKFTKLNPGGVLPYAIGGPVVLVGGMFLLYRTRRRKVDMGGSD